VRSPNNEQGQRPNWRQICEKVLREKDAERFNTLLEELLEALDEAAFGRSARTIHSPRNPKFA